MGLVKDGNTERMYFQRANDWPKIKLLAEKKNAEKRQGQNNLVVAVFLRSVPTMPDNQQEM